MTLLSRRSFAASALLPLLPELRAQSAPPGKKDIEQFFNEFTSEWIRADPSLAFRTRFLAGDDENALERRLTTGTTEWRKERIQRARRGLAALKTFDRSSLSETQQISADLLAWHLQTLIDEERHLDFTFPLDQFQGANVNLVSALVVVHPLATPRDAENYVAALGEFAARMEEAIAESKRIAAKGILPPKFILQSTIHQMENLIDSSPAQNPLVAMFSQKMSAISSLDPEKREQLRASAEEIVRLQIYPAYRKAIALLTGQWPRSTGDAGLWRLKGGPEAYAYWLRHYTTTDMTPEQVHNLGLSQVESLERQMDETLKSMGRAEGSVKQRVEKIQAEMAYPDPTSEASREQIMRDIAVIIEDAQKRSALLFDKRPKVKLVAQPYPAFQEANSSARSIPPSPDGSRPGIYLYPRRLDWMTKFGLRSVTYHEGVPGHFFQIGLQIENPELPRFRRLGVFGFISGPGEGWGLYAERLAAESGWYKDDPAGLLGQLNFELFRARRMVVDTGIHAMRWTRQQAIDYGIEPSEVERYVVMPGQACSYMIGELKIIEMREKARGSLGDKFSLQQFHNILLGSGVVPLTLWERQIDTYIAKTKGRA